MLLLPCPLISTLLYHQASIGSRALTKDIAQADTLVELQDIATENAGQLDAIHVATIFTRARTLTWAEAERADSVEAKQEARQRLAGLVPLWLKLLPDAPMTAVSTLLLAASKLLILDPQLWLTTLAHVVKHNRQTTGFDVCNILFAAAKAAAANRGQVPGVSRDEVVALAQTLLRRMHVIVLAPREGDRLTLLSITNCLWALARFGVVPEPEQLTDLLVTATRPQLFGLVNSASYADLLWSVAVLQVRPQLFGRVRIPAVVEAALFAEDKVRMAQQGDAVALGKVMYSLGVLVQAGALEPGGLAQAAGLAVMTEMEARSCWTGFDMSRPLWAAAVLGLPVKGLLTPDMLQRLLAWVPHAKGQYVTPLADLLVLTGCRHEELMAAALQAAHAARARPDEALEVAAALGAAMAHFTLTGSAGSLVQLFEANPGLRKPDVPYTAHTRQQLVATHAWLCQQQQLRGGRGLAGLVHPALLEGAPGGARDLATEQELGPSSSSSSGNSTSSVGGNGGTDTWSGSSGDSSSSRQQIVTAARKPGGKKKRKSEPGSSRSPRPVGTSGTAGDGSNTSSSSSSSGGGNKSSSSAARPAPPAAGVPFGSSSRQLLPRPQR
jgi:hypothetical protein